MQLGTELNNPHPLEKGSTEFMLYKNSWHQTQRVKVVMKPKIKILKKT